MDKLSLSQLFKNLFPYARKIAKYLFGSSKKQDRPEQRPHHATYWREDIGLMNSFKENEKAIKAGDVPLRYKNIAQCVPGKRILELGAGEGVLSLVLAQTKEQVWAIDINKRRHTKAVNLKKVWSKIGLRVDNIHFIKGDFFQRLDILEKIETVVAVRLIYHLQEDIDDCFKAISEHAKYVVLVGNAEKALIHKKNIKHDLGHYLKYATEEGMIEILTKHGYKIIKTDNTEDPLVIGEKAIVGTDLG